MKAKFRVLKNLLGDMDPIANMIVQIKNAGDVGGEEVIISYSKLKHAILEVLKKEEFIKNVQIDTKKNKKVLNVSLLFNHVRLSTGKMAPRIQGVKRLSKLSKRIYKKFSEIRSVKSGYGALLLSTSKGIMTGREAKKIKLGGEALFTIW